MIEIVNLTGQTLLAEEIGNQTRISIDLESILSGAYLVVISSDEGRSAKRLLVR